MGEPKEPDKEETPKWAEKLQETMEKLSESLTSRPEPEPDPEPVIKVPVPPTPEPEPEPEPDPEPEPRPEPKPKKNFLDWLF